MEFGVDIHDALEIIFTRRNLLDVFQGITEDAAIDRNVFSRFEPFDILAKKGNSVCAHLQPGFAALALSQNGIDSSSHRPRMSR
jgi:hypothetical protein